MFLLHVCKINVHNQTFPTVLRNIRKYSSLKAARRAGIIFRESDEKLINLLKKCAPKIIYNSTIESKKLLKHDYRTNSIILDKLNKQQEMLRAQLGTESPISLSLKYLDDDVARNKGNNPDNFEEEMPEEQLIHFPYEGNSEIELDHATSIESKGSTNNSENLEDDVAEAANEEVRKRNELKHNLRNWMTAYDNYDDTLQESDEDDDIDEWKINYGTPDPKSEISKVPCGGCGALLHCKDTAIPGYIPSEIFNNTMAKGGANLEAIVCQRCHFLKHYNLALQMRVSPEDYPKILATLSNRQGVIILMVDLLDFPCSIWPGIADIFAFSKMPIVVVGNKVDLLLKDRKNYLDRIKETLLNNVRLSGFGTLNIQHVALISAKTGFGVEDLITRLYSLYRHKGDVYIVGCTNVGKSSLFNALLQSDYCKVQAIDLIQRATTSVWPGTTLNLLKFPIKRPAGFRQYLRHKRLQEASQQLIKENALRKEQLSRTKDPKYATVIGHIDVTRASSKRFDENKDSFSVQGHSNASGRLKMGINEKSQEFAYSKWCYDTPGVIQPDQIMHLLTTEELMLTLPKEIIMPRTFCLKPNSTLFIGGLSRLDYVEGSSSVRLTVFSSNELPVTVCNSDDAEEIYETLVGTELFKIPSGGSERLSKWPKLELAQSFTVQGENWKQSVKDVVLSSSGWVAITGRRSQEYKFQAWTPEKRGVYLRECLLPHAVALTGRRIPRSVAYKKHKFYLK